jgi:hypothetical protein
VVGLGKGCIAVWDGWHASPWGPNHWNNIWGPIRRYMVMITLSVGDCTHQTRHPVHEARLDRVIALQRRVSGYNAEAELAESVAWALKSLS